jgi:hypothetical protein
MRRCLVATTDDRWMSIPGGWTVGEVVFSIDGSTVVWLGEAPGDGPRTLWWADLESSSPEVRSTTLIFPADVVIDLSPDGRQILVLDQNLLSVYELENERLLTAVGLPEDLTRSTPFFSTPESIRLYSWSDNSEEWAIQIAEIDAVAGVVKRLGKIPARSGKSWLSFDARLQYLVLMNRKDDFGSPTRILYDAKSGELLRPLKGFSGFLDDGRILSRRRAGNDLWLVVESPDGSEQVAHNLGPAADIWNGGEVLPGRLLILRSIENGDREQGRRADLLDLEDGSWREVGRGMNRIHAGFQWRWGAYRAAFWYVNRPPANRLITDTTGALVRWDPESGELVHVVGGEQ